MARRSRPPLYEFLSKGPRDQGTVAPPRPRDDGPPPVQSVGQSVRVPVGYIFLAAAGVIGIVIASYALGSWQGRTAAERDFYSTYPGEAISAQDPLAARDTGNEAPSTGETGRGTPPLAREEPVAPPAAGPATPARPRAANEDPREPGLHYFVLAETRPEGARRLTAFCRDHGLDAFVIKSDNPRFRRVICLPGLTSSSRSSPEYRDLKNEILRVGRLWKAQYPGERDLSDAYLISD